MTDGSDFTDKPIGNYQLVQKLGGGTFGTVYLAQHRYLNRGVVALKILNSKHLGTQKERDAFFNEAKFLDILKHPHILPIIDVGIQDDLPYIVTAFASKGSLQEHITNQSPARLPMKAVLLILSEIGQALQYAHRHKVVHRDLKPANILFNEKGGAILADFGISLQLKEETEGTEDNADIKGSYPYMAPEQFDKVASVKSDQYALACIAYELFTGKRPLAAPPPPVPHDDFRIFKSWMRTIQTEEPKPLRELNPDVSPNVEKAILKALAKDRLKRHADINTFISLLVFSDAPLLDIPDMPTMFISDEMLQKALKDELPIKTLEQYVEEGDNLRKNNQLQEALEAYEQAIGLGSNDPMVYYYMGFVLSNLKKPDEALVAYEQAIKIDPTKSIFHSSKGAILYELEHFAEALEAYKEAIRLSPTTPIFYIKQGDILLALRDYEEAAQAYDHAIRLASNIKAKAKAYMSKGKVLLRLRKNSDSIEAYEKAEALDPAGVTSSLYLAKGDAFWRCGQNLEALKAYEQGIGLEPDNTLLQEKRAAMLNIIAQGSTGSHQRRIQL